MSEEEFIGKLQMCYVGDRNAFNEIVDVYKEKIEENKEMKKQLDYIRTGEYYNQLRFENEMMNDVICKGYLDDDYKFIDCTHRNTELLEKEQNLIKYLKEELYNLDYGWTKGIVKHKSNKDLLTEILDFVKGG